MNPDNIPFNAQQMRWRNKLRKNKFPGGYIES